MVYCILDLFYIHACFKDLDKLTLIYLFMCFRFCVNKTYFWN